MTKLCCVIFKCGIELKTSWKHLCTTLKCTKMRARVEKLDVLCWTKSSYALIYVAASSDLLWGATMRDLQTNLVIHLAFSRLWRDFCCMATRLSINRMESGDIQRGWGGRFSLEGTGSRVLRVWKFASTLLSSEVGRSLSGNALLHWMYQMWKRVGICSSRALRSKWLE